MADEKKPAVDDTPTDELPVPPEPKPEPFDPFKPRNLRKFFFSHNNCPELIVEAASEKDAIKVGLKRIGLAASPHPCRAWPVKE